MKSIALTVLLSTVATMVAYAQDVTPDSLPAQVLDEVVIHAYEHHRHISETPAALTVLNRQQLERFSNTSILPALNSRPGVRMEERSPGSYRLNIRGSSLRSPYGVRNVKLYYNDIPFTDPGGQSYFNQIGFYNIAALEIIKGSGSSLYGSGTGGVMLINSLPARAAPGLRLNMTAGSYGLRSLNAAVQLGKENGHHTIGYQRLTSDGYRRHSALRRDVGSWDTRLKLGDKDELRTHFLYSDLQYQTPGGLTLSEYERDPRMSRPGNVSFPGAAEANASIRSQMVLAGFSHTHRFGDRLSNTTTAYGIYSRVLNPTIQNYDRRTEPHTGGRTVFRYHAIAGSSSIDLVVGGELQQGFSTIKTYENNAGQPDSLLFDDEINTLQYFAFLQATLAYKNWTATAAVSQNRQQITFKRLNSVPGIDAARQFDNGLTPRLALLYKVSPAQSVYVNIANGFSPPITSELLSSSGHFSRTLAAERGWNYEAGARGTIVHDRLGYDVSVFYFRLSKAIVGRREAGGGSYFINAGGTKQLGLEGYLSYKLVHEPRPGIRSSSVWAAYSYYHFRYDDFRQEDDDFSGKPLPGVAPHTLSLGLDVVTSLGFYAHITYNYLDGLSLNDAATAYSRPANLVALRLGYRVGFKSKYLIDIYTGADNLLNQQYSLGNDVNAFGGRYYNAAPGRNFFIGLGLSYTR